MEQFSLPITHLGGSTADGLSSVKVEEARKELQQVIEIVKSDIERIAERHTRLQDLTARADEMDARSAQFSRKAVQIRRNIWWRSSRMVMSVLATCMLVIVVVVVMSINVPGSIKKHSA